MNKEQYLSPFAVGLTLGILGYISSGRIDMRRFLKKPSEKPIARKEENTNFSEWIEQSYSIEDSRNWLVVYKATEVK